MDNYQEQSFQPVVAKLDVIATISEGFKMGMTNFFRYLLTIILYVLTVWIPYLNVGTTIGLSKIIIKISKGEKFDPFSIFCKENFSQMGDYFILLGLQSMGATVALAFFIIPGLIISMAWKYAIFIMLESGATPTTCLTLSYKITFGEKWRIFFTNLLVCLMIVIASGLLSLIPVVGIFLSIIAVLVAMAFMIGVNASMYKHFSLKL